MCDGNETNEAALTGTFTFAAAPIPQTHPAQCDVVNKKTLELEHSGEVFSVYYDKNLTSNDLE